MGNTVDRFMVDSMTKVCYVNSTGAEASIGTMKPHFAESVEGKMGLRTRRT